MKRLASALLAFLLTAALLAGCQQGPATIEGVWHSADGSTLTLLNGSLTLTDSMGKNILAVDSLSYEHQDKYLYIFVDGVRVRAFEAELEGDSLTLAYTGGLQADFQIAVEQPIELTRAED